MPLRHGRQTGRLAEPTRDVISYAGDLRRAQSISHSCSRSASCLRTIRTLRVVPRVGTRRAELMEMPIMLVVIIMAARWTVLRLAMPAMLSARIGMGWVALVLMLVAEFGFVR